MKATALARRAKKQLALKFYEFHQNNSGGSFDIDDAEGIGPRVYIEAVDAEHANSRAQSLGICSSTMWVSSVPSPSCFKRRTCKDFAMPSTP